MGDLQFQWVSKSGFFRVKDKEAFRKSLKQIRTKDLQVFEETDENGVVRFAIGGYDTLSCVFVHGEEDEYDEELYNLEAFIQPHLPDDEVFVLFDIGHETLTFVGGRVLIVTSREVAHMSLHQWAEEKKHQLLNLPACV
ncbi:hypothetical protein ACFYKX_10805 [Cytobacillus sp. FJAT-54145]|uniref:Uncharacterized protein n=1 Tax=Cytobacillus spartinae TaxID=3299023 RepID=A0ABW6KA40_9BACI